MLRRLVAPLLTIGLVGVVAAQQPPQNPAQPQTMTVWAPHAITPEAIDADMNAKIRAEGMDRSQIMRIEHMLTDVYGPRVTGSPNLENAGKWAIKEMESWGLKNGKMEPWDWGHEGWLNEKASGHIIAPVKDNLVFEVLAWTPSTKGVVTALAVNMIPPTGPTDAEMTAWVNDMGPKIKDKIMLTGAARTPAFVEVEPPKRRDDAQVKAGYMPPNPDAQAAGRGGAGGAGRGNRGGIRRHRQG